MEVRPGYKQTDVGAIPEDWEVRTMGDLGQSLIGLTYKPTDVRPDGILVLRSSNIQDGAIRFDDNVFVDMPVPARIMVRAGDILICVRNGSRELIGKCVRLDERAVGMTFGAFMAVFRTPDSRFVYQQFQSPALKRQIREHLGATINQITNKSLNSFSIPLPPTRAEQEAIAEALSDTDALIESLERLLAKKRQIKQGSMQELLTGKRRLPGFGTHWEANPLKRFARQFIVPMRDKPTRFTGDIPWCRIEDFDGIYLSDSKSGQYVDAETVRLANLKVYPTGTLLVSCSADLGRCAIVARPLVSNQTFIGIEMNEGQASTLFFYYFMTSRANELNNLSSGTTISYLSRIQFEEFVVYVPVDTREQAAIAAVLFDMDAEISGLEVRLAKVRLLKQGMKDELLTGSMRLV